MRVSDFLAAEAELAASETMGVNRYIQSPRDFLFEHLQVLHDPADSVGSLLRCVNVIARFGYSIPALAVAQAEAERFELAQVVSPLHLLSATLPGDALPAFLTFCDRMVCRSYSLVSLLFTLYPCRISMGRRDYVDLHHYIWSLPW